MPDQSAVLAVSRAVMPGLARAAQVSSITELNRDYYEVRPVGADPVRVRVRTGPLGDAVVSQARRDNDGNYTVTVSDRASEAATGRALAHEVALLAAVHAAQVTVAVGPVDGGVDGPIDPAAGLTPRDRARLAEIRVLLAAYGAADPAGRVAVRAEVDALADQLGLRSVDPASRARWGLLTPDVHAELRRIGTPAITSAYVGHVINYPWTTDTEHFRQIDYRIQLADPATSQPLSDSEVGAKLRELNAGAEAARTSVPRMPEFAGQIVHLPADLLLRIQQADPQVAAKVAAEGVYVDVFGRPELRPYAVPGAPMIDYGAKDGTPAYDLRTPEGRRSMLLEDRARVESALRLTVGGQAATNLLAANSPQYFPHTQQMMLVPDALTSALSRLAPEQVRFQEGTATSSSPGTVTAVADRVTLAPPEPGRRNQTSYGRPVDPTTGQHVPLFHGPPVREQVAQGLLGDCGMLASLAAVIGHRPEVMSRLVQPNPDGTVDVVLHEAGLPGTTVTPTGRELRITVTPDVPLHPVMAGDSAYAAQIKTSAAWASAVEKAIAAVDRTWSDARRDVWQADFNELVTAERNTPTTTVAAPSGYARLNRGSYPGWQAELMTQLTGHPARSGAFDLTPGTEPATEAWLAGLLAAGNPVIVGTQPDTAYPGGTPPWGLVAGHAYEVVGVRNGMVELRNPWNMRHPQPIPVRAFLDTMSPWYAHLDAPAPTAVPPTAAPARVATTVRTGLGTVFPQEQEVSFVYYAVLSGTAAAEGLTVVGSGPSGPRVGRWTTGSGPAGQGGEIPVTRADAERIATEVLGFVLPDEPALHGMLGQ